jgi:hypothetical protein
MNVNQKGLPFSMENTIRRDYVLNFFSFAQKKYGYAEKIFPNTPV